MKKKLLVVLVLLSNILLGKDYALIVGVWDYKSAEKFNDLNEKVVKNDIATYKKILIGWNVTNDNITIIKNRNATKDKIIDELKKISNEKSIDRFYMFFTGHGLSAKNPHYKNIKLKNRTLGDLLKNSGAIVPFGHKKSNFGKTLIVGCQDLRPLLEKIDNKAKTGLIMFDACYSKKSSRDNKTKKRINLSKKTLCPDKDMGYPYKKLVYISSSSIKAELGNVSKGLKKCLSKGENQTLTKNEIEKCIQDISELKAQRAKVFGQNNVSVF